jgi:hypothetical protein
VRIITRRMMAASAAERWKWQYLRNGAWYSERVRETHERLAALGSTPGPDDVDAVVGNGSWTDIHECHECGEGGKPVLVEMGESPHEDSYTARLCLDCLRKGVAMAEAV